MYTYRDLTDLFFLSLDPSSSPRDRNTAVLVLVLKHCSRLFSRPINWNLFAMYAKC